MGLAVVAILAVLTSLIAGLGGTDVGGLLLAITMWCLAGNCVLIWPKSRITAAELLIAVVVTLLWVVDVMNA